MLRTRPGRAVTATTLLLVATATATSPAHAATDTRTTLVISVPQSSYGQSVTATATVTASSGLPEGDVVFSVDGLAIKANLGATGVATLVLPRAAVGQHTVSAIFDPQFDDAQESSTSPTQTWTVSQVRTRLQVRVIGRGARIPTSVQVKAAGEFATRPTGRVRFVVRRKADGRLFRSAQRLDGSAVALTRLGTLKKGAYRLVLTYVGDSQHLGERHVETFRVRQR